MKKHIFLQHAEPQWHGDLLLILLVEVKLNIQHSSHFRGKKVIFQDYTGVLITSMCFFSPVWVAIQGPSMEPLEMNLQDNDARVSKNKGWLLRGSKSFCLIAWKFFSSASLKSLSSYISLCPAPQLCCWKCIPLGGSICWEFHKVSAMKFFE